MPEDIYDEYPSLTLAKESIDENIEPLKLGPRIKEIRGKLGITLEEASQRTGLARSTLSKIENEQISPTFQAMQKLAMGLQIDMPQLFEPPRKKVATGRRDILPRSDNILMFPSPLIISAMSEALAKFTLMISPRLQALWG